jgi:hypothetical protein
VGESAEVRELFEVWVDGICNEGVLQLLSWHEPLLTAAELEADGVDAGVVQPSPSAAPPTDAGALKPALEC